MLSTERGKFVDLIERSRINLLPGAPGKAHQALLMGQVPQESQGVFPCPDASDLLFGRVNSEPERLVNQHPPEHKLGCGISKRCLTKALRPKWTLLPVVNGGVSAASLKKFEGEHR